MHKSPLLCFSGSGAGMTLMELVVVIIIIGIFAAAALPNFVRAREDMLDKEAKPSLKLIQTAEKIFAMDNGAYYPSSGSETNIATINQNLRIVLYAGTDRKWDYVCYYNGCAQATRFNGPDARTWRIKIDEDEPVPGATCP
jgi:prepilin-type N-terminal cleavage/methylation domain-containing protein